MFFRVLEISISDEFSQFVLSFGFRSRPLRKLPKSSVKLHAGVIKGEEFCLKLEKNTGV